MTTERLSSHIDRSSRKTAPVALAMALVVSIAAGGHVVAQEAGAGLAQTPGVCLEITTTSGNPSQWTEVVDAIATSARRQPDFLPHSITVAPAAAEGSQTLRIGAWGGDATDPGTPEAREEQLHDTSCLGGDAEWANLISRGLLIAGADRILAAARLPDESGAPPIPEGATAEISVEFVPPERRVRTTLEFEVEIAFGLTTGGTCWIDDVITVDAGQAVVATSSGMDVRLGGAAGCAKFQAFMVDGGAGERAIGLLPTRFPLSDGTVLSLVTTSVVLDDNAIFMSGPIERRD